MSGLVALGCGLVFLAACTADGAGAQDGDTNVDAGSGGSGGSNGSGGTGTGGTGSGGVTSSGGSASGGHLASGGSSGTGGKDSGGAGATGSGGTRGSGGSTDVGGATGGNNGSGGSASGGASGGNRGTGGSASGGATGGNKGSGGSASGGATGGNKGSGGVAGSPGAGGAGASTAITVWIAGDSTVANGSSPCPIGWGAQFMSHFNSNVKVDNRAIGGRSVQTWLYDVSSTLGSDGECVLNGTTFMSAWTAMLSGMKAGDYLFIQFGINDTDATCPRHVGTSLFKTDYGMMAQAAKARGANPIFVTPVSSISCSGKTAVPSRGTFATATQQAGTTYDVPVIDLEGLSVGLYNSLSFCPLPGADTATTFESGALGDFFCEDHTHFETAGAVQIANLMAKALTDQRIGLAAYLK